MLTGTGDGAVEGNGLIGREATSSGNVDVPPGRYWPFGAARRTVAVGLGATLGDGVAAMGGVTTLGVLAAGGVAAIGVVAAGEGAGAAGGPGGGDTSSARRARSARRCPLSDSLEQPLRRSA